MGVGKGIGMDLDESPRGAGESRVFLLVKRAPPTLRTFIWVLGICDAGYTPTTTPSGDAWIDVTADAPRTESCDGVITVASS